MSHKISLETVRHIPLFAHFEDEDARVVENHAILLAGNKDQLLFRKGDPADGFYFLLAGKVKLLFLSPKGEEKILEIIEPGMSFGEAMIFVDRPFPVNAILLQDSQLLYIPKAELMQHLDRKPALGRSMLAALSMRLHGLVKGMESICLLNAQERVVGYLLSLLAKQHPGIRRGPTSIRLSTNKANTASMLNLSPETLSRILHQLSEQGVIAIEQDKKPLIKILDLQALRRRATC